MVERIKAGKPVNEAEEAVIALLEEQGREGWIVVNNVTAPLGCEDREIDLIVVTEHTVTLIDVLGGRGPIFVAGPAWRQGGSEFPNKAQKIEHNAKVFKSHLKRANRDLDRVKVDGLVVLAAPDARLADPQGPGGRTVVRSAELISVLDDPRRRGSFSPADFYRAGILRALSELVGRFEGSQQYGTWQVVGELSEGETLAEYKAVDLSGPGGHPALLQVHTCPLAMPAGEREEHILKIRNGYDALRAVPPHPNVIRFQACFTNPGGSEVVVAMDDHAPLPPGEARPELIVDLLKGLAHLHEHGTLHRGLGPRALVIDARGRGVLTRFDYARTGPSRGARSLDAAALQDSEDRYSAPECVGRPGKLSEESDVFAAGVLVFELATGLPFGSRADLWARLTDVLGPHRAETVRIMCSLDPAERPGASLALEVFSRPEEPDYSALPTGFGIDKYRVVERLGEPGTYSAAYRVQDTLDESECVLKLLYRDLARAREQARTEREALAGLRHPAVSRVLHTNVYNDIIPYLVFEYVEGRTFAEIGRIGEGAVLQAGIQLAQGLVHVHEERVRHRDITPENVLWNERQCKILDFGLAVRADAQARSGVGSDRYLPPDSPVGRTLSPDELADQDVYGLALCLYEAVSGRYPWDTETPPPGTHPRPAEATVELREILDKALSPERRDRFRSAKDLLLALRYGLYKPGTQRRRRLLIIDDNQAPTIIAKLQGAFDCVAAEWPSGWENLVDAGEVSSFDGVMVDLHLGPGHLAEGMEILEYLRDNTDIPTAIITSDTGYTDDSENSLMRTKYRAVKLMHKKGEEFLSRLMEVAEVLTADTGEPACRRILAWLEAARYWREFRMQGVPPDHPLQQRFLESTQTERDIRWHAEKARTAAEFAELDRRALELWRLWFILREEA